MKKILYISFAFLFLFSCTKKGENGIKQKQTIIGDWEYDTTRTFFKNQKKDSLTPPPPSSWRGEEEFEFFQKGTCNYKNGLFNYSRGKGYSEYLGNKLIYTLNKNKLVLKYPGDSIFGTYTYKLSNDSLIFINTKDKNLLFYNRVKPNQNPVKFDKIAVSSSPCFGSCRYSTVVVDKNGTVLMNNKSYTESNGLFIGKISKEEFNIINDRFNKIDIASLKNSYSLNATDGQSVTVVFIKDNKVYNAVNDYMRQSPPLLIQAYTPLIYLSQKVKAKTRVTNPDFDFNSLGNFDFNVDLFYSLSDDEETVLLFDLYKSKKTNVVFKHVYELTLYNEKYVEQKAYSDGRYFKFIKNDKSSVTYDLGYNFFKRNKIQPQKYL